MIHPDVHNQVKIFLRVLPNAFGRYEMSPLYSVLSLYIPMKYLVNDIPCLGGEYKGESAHE